MGGFPKTFGSTTTRSRLLQVILQDVVQCSADWLTEFQVQRSEHSLVTAKLALLLPLRSVRTPDQGFRVKGQTVTASDHQQRVPYSFQRQPATSLTLIPTSFLLVPNTHPTTLTLVPKSFALVPDSQPTIATNRGHHRSQRAPQQGTEEKNSTALRYHVCRVSSALCPARHLCA